MIENSLYPVKWLIKDRPNHCWTNRFFRVIVTFVICFISGFSTRSVLECINSETILLNNGKYQVKPRIPIPTSILIKISKNKSKQAEYDECIFVIGRPQPVCIGKVLADLP